MASRKVYQVAPLHMPVQQEANKLHPAWASFFSIIAESVTRMEKYDITADLASVAANTTAVQSLTVPGVGSDDIVRVIKKTHEAGLAVVDSWPSAKNTVSVQLMNCTGGAIDPASQDYEVIVYKL